ncbi:MULTISPECIES: hypothetical protein [Paraburkholderia]|uniref:Uncharacterized protein n=1 Tax=Paraburkholderia madseniana TaxID=2599607 RepID=A0AAP5BI18_9BURK|nr:MULTISPECIES: hypothetical protein [Paraburkholderia]MCX4149118.1 hypothetical protein [Paraburkholderia madseniana]MDN7152055.1 hypothetical protein [Paraburkholderia sp. WS6]MDQ6410935.1 hypothetical protein [Paraburkholderia madseniana]
MRRAWSKNDGRRERPACKNAWNPRCCDASKAGAWLAGRCEFALCVRADIITGAAWDAAYRPKGSPRFTLQTLL